MTGPNWAGYARHGAGVLPQVTAEAVTRRLLDRLDVRPGQRVLEIGTGSGFSSAVLARLVGPGGHVVSVEIVPELVGRARDLHADDGVAVEILVGDGRHGAPGRAPFDRIVAWATPAGGIPRPWFDQLTDGGVLLAPVAVRALTGCTVVTRWVRRGPTLTGTDVLPGSFAPLDDRPRRTWTGPWAPNDAFVERDGQPWHWLSADWIRALPPASRAALAARTARLSRTPRPDLVDIPALRAFLLATGPDGLTTGFWGGAGIAIGYSDPAGLALLTADGVVLDGDPAAADVLRTWLDRGRGAPAPTPAVVDGASDPLPVSLRL